MTARARTARDKRITIGNHIDPRLKVYEGKDSLWGYVYQHNVEKLTKKLKEMRPEDRIEFCASKEKATNMSPREVAAQGFCSRHAQAVKDAKGDEHCTNFARTIGLLSSIQDGGEPIHVL